MKRILVLIACCGALALGACTSESQLPSPTGKGSIRAVNAIPGSPEMRFLIEERVLSSVSYKQATAPVDYDDFEYNFNFDLLLPGETESTRVATETVKIEKDREHTFVLTGDYANPTVSVWTMDEREWTESETTFEMRFAHLAVNQGAVSVDVYFDAAVEPAVVSNKVATLAYGEHSPVEEFVEGDYIVTVTRAGDVNDVLFASYVTTLPARSSFVSMVFDGDGNDPSELIVSVASDTGANTRLADAATPPTVRFVHAAFSLPTSDIYDDDQLTNRIVAGLAHGAATGYIDVSGGLETYYWTLADSTAAILFEDPYDPPVGSRSTLVAVGAVDEWSLVQYFPNRASIDVVARLNLFHAALDNNDIDIYLLEADTTLDGTVFPLWRGLLSPGPAPGVTIVAGSYDLVVTTSGEQTPLAPAFRIDAMAGDVVDLVVLDTVDPSVPEVKRLPPP
jgi:hypothetical protein